MFRNLINLLKSILNLITNCLYFCNSNNIDVEILFKSEYYIVVNKPEDVFINNHNKKVSNFTVLATLL